MDKVGIITGAGRGIGRELALGLVKDGFKIAAVSRTASELKSVLSKAEAICPGSFYGISLDVSDSQKSSKFVEDVLSRWGRVDLLINNAGIYKPGTVTADLQDFKAMLEINVIGAFNLAKAVVPIMRQQRSGHIVNISSVAAVTPFATTGAYSASKAALNGLSESLLKEVAADGISVTAICPSWVNTALAAQSGVPSDQMIQPDDILQAVRFLLTLSRAAMVPEIVIHCRSTVG